MLPARARSAPRPRLRAFRCFLSFCGVLGEKRDYDCGSALVWENIHFSCLGTCGQLVQKHRCRSAAGGGNVLAGDGSSILGKLRGPALVQKWNTHTRKRGKGRDATAGQEVLGTGGGRLVGCLQSSTWLGHSPSQIDSKTQVPLASKPLRKNACKKSKQLDHHCTVMLLKKSRLQCSKGGC
jgi:hypothetical protein